MTRNILRLEALDARALMSANTLAVAGLEYAGTAHVGAFDPAQSSMTEQAPRGLGSIRDIDMPFDTKRVSDFFLKDLQARLARGEFASHGIVSIQLKKYDLSNGDDGTGHHRCAMDLAFEFKSAPDHNGRVGVGTIYLWATYKGTSADGTYSFYMVCATGVWDNRREDGPGLQDQIFKLYGYKDFQIAPTRPQQLMIAVGGQPEFFHQGTH